MGVDGSRNDYSYDNERNETEQDLPHINHTANKIKQISKVIKRNEKSYNSLKRTNIQGVMDIYKK